MITLSNKDVYVIMTKDGKHILKGDPQHYDFHLIDDEPNKRIAMYPNEKSAMKALRTTGASLKVNDNKYVERKNLLEYCEIRKCKFTLILEK